MCNSQSAQHFLIPEVEVPKHCWVAGSQHWYLLVATLHLAAAGVAWESVLHQGISFPYAVHEHNALICMTTQQDQSSAVPGQETTDAYSSAMHSMWFHSRGLQGTGIGDPHQKHERTRENGSAGAGHGACRQSVTAVRSMCSSKPSGLT